MSERTKCEECRGEYLPVQRDGSTYQHVCPPPPAIEEMRQLDAYEVGAEPAELDRVVVAPRRKMLRRVWDRLRRA